MQRRFKSFLEVDLTGQFSRDFRTFLTTSRSDFLAEIPYKI